MSCHASRTAILSRKYHVSGAHVHGLCGEWEAVRRLRRKSPNITQESPIMSHRYALAAVLLAALSVPAAAQQTTPSDTSKKSTSGTTVTESAGAIADTAAKAN